MDHIESEDEMFGVDFNGSGGGLELVYGLIELGFMSQCQIVLRLLIQNGNEEFCGMES